MPSLRLASGHLALGFLVGGVMLGAVHAADVTVSAAASLTNAFKNMAGAFENQRPGMKVRLNFAASDALLQQIANGAPVDVFASADEETMDKAEAQKLIAAGSRKDFAANSLAVIAPADSRLKIDSLADLRQPGVAHVAIGAPAGVPAGRYAKAALESAQIWPAIEAKAVYAQSVRQALDYVARGEAEAGFVYLTDALVMKDQVKVAFTVPTEKPVRYPLALTANGPNAAEARGFVDFVASPAGQAILETYGFRKP